MYVRLGEIGETEEIQRVFNHKSIIQYLGGFTMEETIKQKIKPRTPSLWVAENDEGQFVGATMVAGRTQAHILKYGEVGVIEEYRRKRIGSALYLAMTGQGILEGRRLFEDTIVGDNPTQFYVLPTLGMNLIGELKHKTASAKSICLFQLDLLDVGKFEKLISRVLQEYKIQIVHSSYTDDLWRKNMDIYMKYIPEFVKEIERLRQLLIDAENIEIVKIVDEKKDKTEKKGFNLK